MRYCSASELAKAVIAYSVVWKQAIPKCPGGLLSPRPASRGEGLLMAVITAALNITGEIETWAVPKGPVIDHTPVPRGLLIHQGQVAIAAKITTNETRALTTLTMNSSFAYLLRDMTLTISSDDEVMDFQAAARVSFSQNGTDPNGELFSDGIVRVGAALLAQRIYHPSVNFPKLLFGGPGSGDVTIDVGDVSTDASSAGDILFYASWFIYDLEQVRRWPINAPQPVISL